MLAAKRLLFAALTTFLACAGTASAATVVSHNVANSKSQTRAFSPQALRNAKPLSPVVSAAEAKKLSQTTAAGPQGAAGRVSGTAGAVATAHRAGAPTVKPLLGSSGTPWYGASWLRPATTTGKVFFQDHNGNWWVCSGSLTNSEGKDLVETAGHCVYGAAGGEIPGEGWHSNWLFAPDYQNGYAPYGYWTAKQLWTVGAYINSSNQSDETNDIGAAILNTNSSGSQAVNLLGGQGIAWNYGTSQYVYAFGYPAAAPFTGEINETCTGSDGWGLSIGMEVLPCNFTGGSSGGPWLAWFNGEFGYENGVNDARYGWPYNNDMASLYFGNNVAALYQATRSL